MFICGDGILLDSIGTYLIESVLDVTNDDEFYRVDIPSVHNVSAEEEFTLYAIVWNP